MPEPLTMLGVEAGYGLGGVLRGVDLEVAAGGITCIIGPNGAGKSTLLKTISGLLHLTAGSITFAGQSLGGLSPAEILGRGVVQVPQDRSAFPQMTVWENLLMGGYILRNRKEVHRRAERVLEMFPALRPWRRNRAGALSGGQQRMVELGRAMMLEPRMMLMDEISMGLEPRARAAAFGAVGTIRETGCTVLIVEQNARAGLAVADVGVVMEGGRVRLVRAAKDLLTDPEVARLYLGQSMAARAAGGGKA